MASSSKRPEQAFEDNLINLIGELPRRNKASKVYRPFEFVQYLKNTWLDEHKQKAVFSLFDELEEIITFGIPKQAGDETFGIEKPYGEEYWFMAPKCTQLAACTFNRPVCVHYTGQAIAYLPLMSPNKSKPSTAPILMQSVETSTSNKVNNWVALELKRSIKIT
ncbi:hypothetical protein [Parasitella parasitica]|uniref:Uncharacterized protein n=1 Tax=Parasitella parasitica TaxID=35722 RepID=A0A0B7NMZ1_9FUNG|nr:hypothetical protein [Parasitella parasitica]